jgi:hypothetical protein
MKVKKGIRKKFKRTEMKKQREKIDNIRGISKLKLKNIFFKGQYFFLVEKS